MRILSLLRFSAIAVLLAACDGSPSPLIAGIGGATAGSGGLSITPAQVTLTVGGTAQLSANLPVSSTSSVQWSSNSSLIAAVSPSGLVTGISAGSTTIVARLADDTTSTGSATVTVTP